MNPHYEPPKSNKRQSRVLLRIRLFLQSPYLGDFLLFIVVLLGYLIECLIRDHCVERRIIRAILRTGFWKRSAVSGLSRGGGRNLCGDDYAGSGFAIGGTGGFCVVGVAWVRGGGWIGHVVLGLMAGEGFLDGFGMVVSCWVGVM